MVETTLIIAEAGVNHNGDIEIAKQLIDVAANAGADMVKFQTFNADRLATSTARKAEYQVRNTSQEGSQLDMLRLLELTPAMHEALINHCEERGIAFFSTGFDIESVNLLANLGFEQFKIPSGEITNIPYLRHVGRLKKPVILSTGMATMDEIGAALGVLEDAGTPRSAVTVLHCTTEYPTPMAEVNLRAMCTIAKTFGTPVGYSDHTNGIEVAIAAAAMGAKVIEKHFTLDRKLPGPDHQASLEPHELAAMIRAIRNIEQALGDGVKRPTVGETKNRAIARKSIVAACPIKRGEHFTEQNLTTKRPGHGISPMRWDEILSQTAVRDFSANELITL